MKKILTSLAVIAMCSNVAFAQTSTDTTATSDKDMHKKHEERMKNMTPEQKKHMEERREEFKSLPPEKQEALKKEMKRHHDEMKKITGKDMPMGPRED